MTAIFLCFEGSPELPALRLAPLGRAGREEPVATGEIAADAGARYPVTIDPLRAGVAEMQLESNQSSASPGARAASAGDGNGDGYGDVIAGAPYYDAGQNDGGAAFVFPGGAWKEETDWAGAMN